MKRRTVQLVREGKYVAEVSLELIEDESEWSPYVSKEDALKMDAVRRALRDGDISAAAKLAPVFELLPISA